MTGEPLVPGVGDRLLDRYLVTARFTGGMGILWTVRDAHTGLPYAVKTVRPEQRGRSAMVRRFREEAGTWIALGQHDHLVGALWLVEGDDAPYLVLDYVPGADLAAVLAQDGPLPLERGLDFAMQCAAGMAYAHTRAVDGGVGVIHRDLKPSNLLVTPEDRLKVTDFGLAEVLRDLDSPVGGPGAGTPAYMAPEQLVGEGAVDGRADVFSFGLVLYEMLAGRNPLAVDGELPQQVEATLHRRVPPLTSVPPALSALIARCLAKDPAQRPRDFSEVLSHLAAIARGLRHRFHVDPSAVPPPQRPAGLALEEPAVRPRRPRAGEPFAVELVLRGDIGPGPVEVEWRLDAPADLAVLSPAGLARARVEAGGSVEVKLRLMLSAERVATFQLPAGVVTAHGPAGASEHVVAPFEIEVAFAFVLPLQGRDAILERLRAPGALILYGGIGSGKTRMLVEAERLAAQLGARTISTRAHDTGLRPLQLLTDLACKLLDLRPGESAGAAAAVNDLLGDDPATTRYFTQLLAGNFVLEHEAPLAHRWFTLLRAAAARGPIAVLLDDLHLVDASTIRTVAGLVKRAREGRLQVLFVITFTHGQSTTLDSPAGLWMRRGIELEPLGGPEVTRLLDAAFPGHRFEEEAPWLAGTLSALTGGNPYHAVEILRFLRYGPERTVRVEDGEWHVAPDLSPARLRELVPGQLEAAVRRAVDALSARAREVLETAALAGDEFDAELLRAVVGDEAAVDAALEELERAALVRPVDVDVDLDRYRFRGAVVAPVVQRALHARAPERERALHLDLAESKLLVYRGERLVRRALSIAHHLHSGGEGVRSLPWTLAGCERLLALQQPERARRLLAEAKRLVDSPGVPERVRLGFFQLYGLACESSGDYDEGLEALTRFVEGSTAAAGEARSLPRVYRRLGRIHRARGEFERAQYCLGVARQLLEDLGDARALAFAMNGLAELALDRGRFEEAERHLTEGQRLAAETGNEAAAIEAAILRGRTALAMERPVEARLAFADAEQRARFLGDRVRRAAALKGLGLVALGSGYLQDARAHLDESIDLLAGIGDRSGRAAALLHLGAVYRAAGRADRALRHLRRAQGLFREIGHPEGVAAAHHGVGQVLREWGRTAHAVRELAAAAEEYRRLELPETFQVLQDLGEALADSGAERAARITLARADRGVPAGPARRAHRIRSRLVRACLAMHAGDVDRASVLALRALHHSARTTGHGSRIAAHLAVADTSLAAGDLDRARTAAETALAFAREQGAPISAAAGERVLLEIAAREWRPGEARERAHRAARAYTGRSDVLDGPARLLLAYAGASAPNRAERLLCRARSCYRRLEAQGHRGPPR